MTRFRMRLRRTGRLGRADSNLRIRNRARLDLPLSCGAKSGSRSCRRTPSRRVHYLPSSQGTTAVKPAGTQIPDAEFDVKTAQNGAVRHFADMALSPCAEFGIPDADARRRPAAPDFTISRATCITVRHASVRLPWRDMASAMWRVKPSAPLACAASQRRSQAILLRRER